MARDPAVSVLVAVHNGAPYLRPALESVLRQTVSDLELVVVDDGSTDETAAVLESVEDRRLRVVRSERRRGLAGALNLGLDEVRGRRVARMDADDVAFPYWLARVLARLDGPPPVVLVGAGVLEMHDAGCFGAVHVPEAGPAVTRWHSLFSSSPFFHNTVVFERDHFDRNGLRYDESFVESEDYELWTRVLAGAEADVVEAPLVAYRLHAGQASKRRAELQRELGRRVALGQIAAAAPSLSEAARELAWRFGFLQELAPDELEQGADAYTELVCAFDGSGRYGKKDLAPVRRIAARTVARRAGTVGGAARARLVRRALALDPALVLHVAERRARRVRAERRARSAARETLRAVGVQGAGRVRAAVVLPEPTPYRTGMLDRLAERPEVDLTVVYAAPAVQRRAWEVELRHRAVLLDGRRVPGASRVLRHDYPLSTGVFRALRDALPEVVVVSGWSTFASQATIAWCRRHGVPYVLLVESNERDARPGWRRAVKGAVVPWVVGGAAEVFVVGTLARESMLARGVDPERVSVLANTVDVERLAREADALAQRRDALRDQAGLQPGDIAVLSVARLAPEKGLDSLVRAVGAAGDPRLVLLLAGSGPEREPLRTLADRLGVRLVLLPDVPWERIAERYVLADVFALLSRHEPWGVVVNEAAACRLPLVLSDRVGAAYDLLEDGRNGVLVPADDVAAAAAAIRDFAADPERRRRAGAASRELVRAWGYEPSIENFVDVVRRVAGRRVAARRVAARAEPRA
ncbi:MAG TPA: glycosyltransferase [Gaiella sp.]|nr:glycosyltransferase [Gaiella sp.]